ncbi:MAG: iron-only hydrogenase system regulator [Lachnospiraceae bacterium]|nr:iron-only hydrogenase system regulator [Lachnospiraceae bacterium]
METRVALMSILVEESEGHPSDSVRQMNDLLHEYGQYIIGRMGIPYHAKHVSIISIAMDAPQDAISALSGKIGRLQGVTVKTTYTK